MDDKRFLLAEVKATGDDGDEFLSVLSAPTLDRDLEIIDTNAFAPLPDSLPIHAYHDFGNPVARGVPFYDGDVLHVRGYFASTPRAQEIRTLVKEGIIGSMSVGFRAAERDQAEDGVTHIKQGELLEGSFVSVPSNREAAVLMAKEYRAKVGARNSAADGERLQTAHDVLAELGAKCAPVEDERGCVVHAGKHPTLVLDSAGNVIDSNGNVVNQLKARIEHDVKKHQQQFTKELADLISREVPDVKTEGEENSTGMSPVDQARLAIARLEADLLLAD